MAKNITLAELAQMAQQDKAFEAKLEKAFSAGKLDSVLSEYDLALDTDELINKTPEKLTNEELMMVTGGGEQPFKQSSLSKKICETFYKIMGEDPQTNCDR